MLARLASRVKLPDASGLALQHLSNSRRCQGNTHAGVLSVLVGCTSTADAEGAQEITAVAILYALQLLLTQYKHIVHVASSK